MVQSAQKFLNSKFLVLLTLWLIATLLNLNKAFHIDDTFHLEAAQWIEENPLQPMSGFINWDNNSIPVYHYNQPPLYFYLIALVGSIFGYSEIALHIFQSLFTLLAVVVFYKIAETVQPKHALLLTAFFVLNPAFLVNQNLMVDIPLLSLHLLFIYILIKPEVKSEKLRYSLAAIVISAALLIKYTSLPLLVLLVLVPLLKRQQKYGLAAAIPVVVLGLWSVFNYYEYGSIHIHSRPANMLSWLAVSQHLLSFVLCIGAVAPFSIAFFTGISEKYRRGLTTIALLAIIIFFCVLWLWYAEIITDRTARRVFLGGFILNGFVVLYLSFNKFFHPLFQAVKAKENIGITVIILWCIGMSSFIVLFAPFMATRHALLVLPSVLLLCSRYLGKVETRIKALAVGASFGLSMVLGVSDWVFADFYRRQAFEVKDSLPEGAVVWSVGHWGWQWYSKAAGMKQYETDSAQVSVQDFIVVPLKIAQQKIGRKFVVKEVRNIVPPSTKLTFFSTSGIFASFYMSDHFSSPWALTKAPVDTISIFQVVKIKERN